MANINFSIIIPHKNIPDLLLRCIDSIPIRDDLEIIVVDDNSDADKRKFEEWKFESNRHIQFITCKESRGAGAARNIGIKRARGEWVLFADSDDTYTQEFNSFLDRYIDSDSDVIYFKSNVLNADGSEGKPTMMNLYIDRYLNNVGLLDDVKYGAWEPWNKMIKRSIIEDYNLQYEEIPSSNDKMFSLHLGTKVRKVEVSDMVIYNYMLRSDSIIHRSIEKKFPYSFYSCLRQNELYHSIGYKRMVFMPYSILTGHRYMTKQMWRDYKDYLRRNKTHPLEGLWHYMIFHLILRRQ